MTVPVGNTEIALENDQQSDKTTTQQGKTESPDSPALIDTIPG